MDYNQAYSPQEAVKAIKAIEPYNIDVAEQPVAATDYVGNGLRAEARENTTHGA